MADKPLLSVALIFHNQRDIIESALSALYNVSDFPFELIVVDDSSTDGSRDAIMSLLDYHQHESTFFFDHDKQTGRGNSLNEAILQCNAPFFWAPASIQQLHGSRIANQLASLKGSSKQALLQKQVPDKPEEWSSFIKNEQWLQDGDIIWNLPALATGNHFFNPYIKQYHGMELAVRLGGDSFKQAADNWYSPSSFLGAPQVTAREKEELLFTVLRKTNIDDSGRDELLDDVKSLAEQDKFESRQAFDNDLLKEAQQLKEDGRYTSALAIIEEVLNEQPNHQAANELKIDVLEKKRRFVEASELKHEVSKANTKQKQPSKEKEPDQHEQTASESAGDQQTEVSLIIPTTAYGKAALEHCLLSISEHCSTERLELIIIDNASLDDTHDYLQELQEKEFMNCRIITNAKNIGFPASVNRGLKASDKEYACILHNDVEFANDTIGQLKSIMDDHPGYAVIGPTTNKTLNPEQAEANIDDGDSDLREVEYLDSFCMMIRNSADITMDSEYEMAFFEDIDYCFQARSQGHKIGIAPQCKVQHHLGTTTFALNLDTDSRQYWKNVSYFNQKWNIEVFSDKELKSLSTFDQLLALDNMVNPFYPEEKIKTRFKELFSDELKTEILESEHEDDTLCQLVHLFMVMGEREIMRELENRLDDVDIPPGLIFHLVQFYYDLNIYSRCSHYLKRLPAQHQSVRAELYRLAIHVDDKNLDEAIPMLKYLMDEAPANPMIYKLAGDIHHYQNNQEEAESFYDLAMQINPFQFSDQKKDPMGFSL